MQAKMSLWVKVVAISFRVGSSDSSAEFTSISAELTIVAPRAMTVSYHLAILPYAVSSVEGDDSVYHGDDDIVHVTINSSHQSESLEVSIRLKDIED